MQEFKAVRSGGVGFVLDVRQVGCVFVVRTSGCRASDVQAVGCVVRRSVRWRARSCSSCGGRVVVRRIGFSVRRAAVRVSCRRAAVGCVVRRSVRGAAVDVVVRRSVSSCGVGFVIQWCGGRVRVRVVRARRVRVRRAAVEYVVSELGFVVQAGLFVVRRRLSLRAVVGPCSYVRRSRFVVRWSGSVFVVQAVGYRVRRAAVGSIVCGVGSSCGGTGFVSSVRRSGYVVLWVRGSAVGIVVTAVGVSCSSCEWSGFVHSSVTADRFVVRRSGSRGAAVRVVCCRSVRVRPRFVVRASGSCSSCGVGFVFVVCGRSGSCAAVGSSFVVRRSGSWFACAVGFVFVSCGGRVRRAAVGVRVRRAAVGFLFVVRRSVRVRRAAVGFGSSCGGRVRVVVRGRVRRAAVWFVFVVRRGFVVRRSGSCSVRRRVLFVVRRSGSCSSCAVGFVSVFVLRAVGIRRYFVVRRSVFSRARSVRVSVGGVEVRVRQCGGRFVCGGRVVFVGGGGSVLVVVTAFSSCGESRVRVRRCAGRFVFVVRRSRFVLSSVAAVGSCRRAASGRRAAVGFVVRRYGSWMRRRFVVQAVGCRVVRAAVGSCRRRAASAIVVQGGRVVFVVRQVGFVCVVRRVGFVQSDGESVIVREAEVGFVVRRSRCSYVRRYGFGCSSCGGRVRTGAAAGSSFVVRRSRSCGGTGSGARESVSVRRAARSEYSCFVVRRSGSCSYGTADRVRCSSCGVGFVFVMCE
ncbi:unnamed protein product, partial [Gadus morhua 'NCC']